MDIVATARRHPKNGETVFGSNLQYFPGGKGANQAIASSKLGAKTVMVGKVGDDAFGAQLIDFLKRENIETNISIEKGVPTGTALITVSEETSDNTIVVIPGANFSLSKGDIENADFGKGDILVSQFEIPDKTIEEFFSKGRRAGTVNIFNSAPARPISAEFLDLVDILILNETELSYISETSVEASKEESILTAIKKLQRNHLKIIVTLGEKGVLAFDGNKITRVPGRKVDSVDSTGAGDCFVGAFAAGILSGKFFAESLAFANIAASISVTRKGAGPSMPTLEEVEKQSIYLKII